MAAPFELGGDPAAIRASAARWGTFAGRASGASGRIARMDASEFVGTEGEQYREALNSDMRPHLDTTATAWSKVHGALTTYADTLERLQERMATVAATAQSQRTTLHHAQTRLDDSRSADFRHRFMEPGFMAPGAVSTATGAGSTAKDTYQSHTAEYSGAVTTAQQALQGSIDAANRIHAEHETAVTMCCGAIDVAKALRFIKPPGWFSRAMHSVGHWIKQHSKTLLDISAILKQISSITGMLALIPIEPFQAIMMGISLGTGVAALAIDVAVKLATGQGSWAQMGIDALSLIPGAKALRAGQTVSRVVKVARAAQTYAPKVAITGLTAYQATQGDASWADVAIAAAGVSQNKKFGIVTGYAGAINATYKVASSPNPKWTDYGDAITAIGTAGITHRVNTNEIRQQQAASAQHEPHNQPPPERWPQPDSEATRNATDRYVQRGLDGMRRQLDRGTPSINHLLDRQDRAAEVAGNHADQYARSQGDSFTNAANATGRQLDRVSQSVGPILDRQANSASRLFDRAGAAAANIPSHSGV